MRCECAESDRFVFTNLKSGDGVDQIASFVIEKGGLATRRTPIAAHAGAAIAS
jgi:hypothetical protein